MEMTVAQRFEHRSHFEERNVLLLWLHGSKKYHDTIATAMMSFCK